MLYFYLNNPPGTNHLKIDDTGQSLVGINRITPVAFDLTEGLDKPVWIVKGTVIDCGATENRSGAEIFAYILCAGIGSGNIFEASIKGRFLFFVIRLGGFGFIRRPGLGLVGERSRFILGGRRFGNYRRFRRTPGKRGRKRGQIDFDNVAKIWLILRLEWGGYDHGGYQHDMQKQ